jgi:hypothetical protein
MKSKLILHLDEVRQFPTITLGGIITEIKNDALIVVCLISILPFLQPIPLPGLSTLLGFIILLQGLGLMFLSRPLLTEKMRGISISAEKFKLIYNAALNFTHFASKISIYQHPWVNSRLGRFFAGLSITVAATFLSLPLPIPFSNFIPALSIAFVCLGLLEEDLILLIIGISILIAIIWMGAFSYHLLKESMSLF